MLVTRIFAEGFRCFGPDNPLDLELRPSINVLVGENDSGKTAIADAIRLALGTRSEDFARLGVDDFHASAQLRCEELVVRCTLDALTEVELRRFLEWCAVEDGRPKLHVHVTGRLQRRSGGGRRVWCEHRAGRNGDGPPIDGALREYLRVAYLRPLRDAERQLRPGRGSRLSQILAALPEMHEQAKPSTDEGVGTLATILATAHGDIRKNDAIGTIEGRLNNDYLRALLLLPDDLVARLGLGSELSMNQILERLELALEAPERHFERVPRGLGMNNVLFMAAELLLLQSADDQMATLVIEEPEAHLHPQLQVRFMHMLERRVLGSGRPQVILTTHSPLLASGADLESIVYCQAGSTFPLKQGSTKLETADYAFLRRFLDATKANLFFARGVLVVEGDAEGLLLPAIADKLGLGLTAHGVSIVKVGHTGLFRYSRILQRQAGSPIRVPVACVGDRDIPPDEAKGLDGTRPAKTQSDYTKEEIRERMESLRRDEGFPVAVFIAEHWTLEYDLALSGLAVELHQAAGLVSQRAKPRETVLAERKAEVEAWTQQGQSPATIACRVYGPLYRGTLSKAEVAEHLAQLIAEDTADLRARLPPYLLRAIEYVTTPLELPSENTVEGDP